MNGTLELECTILLTCLRDRGVGARQVVGPLTTAGDFGCAMDLSEYTDLKDIRIDTVQDFFEKNAGKHPILPPLDLDGMLLPVHGAELKKIFSQENGWDRFREAYPQSSGIVQISRVGLNAELSQALLYVGNQANANHGSGFRYLYIKDGSAWKEADKVRVWAS